MKKISKTLCLLSFFGLLVFPATLYADFVWVDHNGNTRRTKFAPKAHQVRKYISTGQKQQTKKRNTVELFVTSWCPYCHKAKAFFEKRNIAIKVYDIEKSQKAAARKRKLDPQRGVPFAIVNGKGIHGYAPDQYLQALKSK